MCCSEKCSKCLLFFLNALFLLFGLGLVGLGVFASFTQTEYHELVGSSMIQGATYAVIGVGAIVALVAMAGCIGGITMNRKVLMLYIFLLIVVFLLEAACSVLGFLYYEQARTLLDTQVYDAVTTKYGDPDYGLITHAVDFMQQQLDCCGYIEPQDWSISEYIQNMTGIAVPISCCIDINVNNCNQDFNSTIHTQGCMPSLESLVKSNLLIIGIACVSIAVIQLIGVISSIHLYKKSSENEMQF